MVLAHHEVSLTEAIYNTEGYKMVLAQSFSPRGLHFAPTCLSHVLPVLHRLVAQSELP